MASPLATVARYLLPFLVVVMGQPVGRGITSSISGRGSSVENEIIYMDGISYDQICVRGKGKHKTNPVCQKTIGLRRKAWSFGTSVCFILDCHQDTFCSEKNCPPKSNV